MHFVPHYRLVEAGSLNNMKCVRFGQKILTAISQVVEPRLLIKSQFLYEGVAEFTDECIATSIATRVEHNKFFVTASSFYKIIS